MWSWEEGEEKKVDPTKHILSVDECKLGLDKLFRNLLMDDAGVANGTA